MAAPCVSPAVRPNRENAFTRRFEFVDGLGGKAAIKKTRSHVTREFYREQRHIDMNSSAEGRGKAVAPFARSLPMGQNRFVVRVTDLTDSERKSSQRQKATGRKGRDGLGKESAQEAQEKPSIYVPLDPDRSKIDDAQLTNSSSTLGKQSSMARCLISPLGASRRDPFDCLAVKSTDEVARLVDYWYFEIPYQVQEQWRSIFNPRQPRPCRNLIYLYREDPATFFGLLHYAALHMKATTSRAGVPTETAVITYKYQAIRAVNERLKANRSPNWDDITIFGVCLLANSERIWGDSKTARLHASAVRRMVIDRGGLTAFLHHRLLHAKLIWSIIALPLAQPYLYLSHPIAWLTLEDDGKDGLNALARSSSSLSSSSSSSSSSPSSTTGSGNPQWEAAYSSFMNFLAARKRQTLHLQTIPSTAHHRFHAFRPGSKIVQILSSLTSTTTQSPPQPDPTLQSARLASLIYINLLLSIYGDLSESSDHFLRQFFFPSSPQAHQTHTPSQVDIPDHYSPLSSEHLLWSLINMTLIRGAGGHVHGTEEEKEEERNATVASWRLAEWMDVCKASRITLGSRWWEDVEGILWRCLTLN